MKAKTIKSILAKKTEAWLESITDDNVRKLVGDGVIVTGGAITSMLLGEEVKDIDVYLSSKEAVLAVAKYYVEQFNSLHPDHTNKLGGRAKAFVLDGADVAEWKAGNKTIDEIAPGYENQGTRVSHMITNTAPDRVKIIVRSDGIAAEDKEVLNEPAEDIVAKADELSDSALDEKEEDKSKPKFRPVFLSSNAITLSGRIQIVVRFYGSPEEIHKNYDFVHCTNYWTRKSGELVLNPKALECILNKELIYQGSKYPLCSVIRTRKFIARGWQINAGQYLKMLFQVSELDLTDIAVLEDQLVGVDSAYFMQLIDALREHQEKHSDFVVSSGYIATIIDRLF
jgi:hypothetical protein